MTTAGGHRAKAPIRVHALGPLVVTRSGHAVAVPGVRLRALLTALAAMVERRVSCDELVEAVWPHRAPAGAGRTLRSHVARLRRLLGAASIVTESGGYRLSLANVELDTDELAQLRVKLRAGGVVALPVLRRAMEMWRDVPFPELADWLPGVVASRSLTEAYVAVCEHVVEAEIGSGSARDTIADLERLVAEFPLRESLWVLLARARYAVGDHVDALRACHGARLVLADTAGVAPGRDLVAIERMVLAHSPADAMSSVSTPAVDHRLVGRDADLQGLRDACATAGLVVVAGESGIGKTALLDAFVTGLRADGAVVGRGLCEVTGRGTFGALRGVLSDLGIEGVDTRMPGDRVAQVAAFTRSLLDAARGALTVVLDDAHWLSGDEVDIVESLVLSAGLPVTWVVAVRPDDAADNEALDHLVRAATRAGRFAHVDVRGVDREAVRVLARREAVPAAELEAVVDTIWARADGHPFFTVELLRSATGPASMTASIEPMVPATVRELVDQRLRRLGPVAVAVLEVAAVAGPTFSVGAVASAATVDPDTVVRVLDRAVTARLLRSGWTADAHGGFVHSLTRDAIVERLSFARRAQLHCRLADALDGRGEQLAVASHTLAAADLVGPAVAAQRFERAAHACFVRGAYADALGWIDAAATLAPTSTLAALRCRVLLGLGRGEEALGPLVALLALDDASVAPLLVAIAGDLAELANATTYRIGAPLLALTDRAMKIVSAAEPQWPRVALGWARTREFNVPNAVVFDVVKCAARLARARGDHEMAALALAARLERGANPIRAHETLSMARTLIALADEMHRPEQAAMGLSHKVSALLQLGCFDEAATAMAALARQADDASHPLLAACAGFAASWRPFLDGDLDTYISMVRAVRPVLAGVMPDIADGTVDGNIAIAAHICGVDYDAVALDDLRAGGTPDRADVLDWYAAHADDWADNTHWGPYTIVASTTCWTTRSIRHAEQLHTRLVPLAGRHLVVPFTFLYGGAVDHHLAGLETLLGDLDVAIDRIETAIKLYQRLGSPLYQTLAAEILVTALARRGRPSDRRRAASVRRHAMASATKLHLDALAQRLDHLDR